MPELIAEMFSYPFMVRALVVGTLLALCSSLLGVTLVLKRFAMIGDGLSHVGFAALALASAMHMLPLALSIPVVVLAAFVLLHMESRGKMAGDAVLALFSTSALAIGVMTVSLTTGMNTDVCNYLFGSILSMGKSDVILSCVVAGAVLIAFVLCYNRIFAVVFDEGFARATGLHTGWYNTFLAIMVALVIALGMRMMGALLISSLIVFPALTSMQVCKKFRAVVLSSTIIAVLCLWAGIFCSYTFATPTGASIVMCNLACFLGYKVFALACRRKS